MLKSTILRDDAALDAAFSESNTRPVLLFKHSLICGVSMAAMEELRDYLADPKLFRTAEMQRLGTLDYGVPRRAGL